MKRMLKKIPLKTRALLDVIQHMIDRAGSTNPSWNAIRLSARDARLLVSFNERYHGIGERAPVYLRRLTLGWREAIRKEHPYPKIATPVAIEQDDSVRPALIRLADAEPIIAFPALGGSMNESKQKGGLPVVDLDENVPVMITDAGLRHFGMVEDELLDNARTLGAMPF